MKTTITLPELTAFTTVVRHGSFTSAAEALGSSKAQLSRQVTRLETRLGVQLLQRSTRHLSVTEAGRELNQRASDILLALEDTEAALSNAGEEPSGRLRVVAGTEYGPLVVSHWISAYLTRYPAMKIDAAYTNRLDDIVHDGIDVAIRVGTPKDSELIAKRLGQLTYQLCAAPSYLDRHGTPEALEALHEHRRIAFAPRGRAVWRLTDGESDTAIFEKPAMTVNSQLLAYQLVVDGHGIGLLADHQIHDELAKGHLRPVLSDWSRKPVPVNALFTKTRYLTPKVRSFVDLCAEQFETLHPGIRYSG